MTDRQAKELTLKALILPSLMQLAGSGVPSVMCAACEGNGMIRYLGAHNDEVWEECTSCGGTGVSDDYRALYLQTR